MKNATDGSCKPFPRRDARISCRMSGKKRIKVISVCFSIYTILLSQGTQGKKGQKKKLNK
jgi:hypothetical protein